MQKAKWEKAVFLDRDGVINYDSGTYTFKIEDFSILPGVFETLAHWKSEGFGLMVFTNQAGISKSMYTKSDVDALHQYFQGMCNLHGFAIDAFYFCPHHEDYSGKCLCRKPGSLMLEKALHTYRLEAGNCIMIGDKQRDVDAASKAGVKGVLIETNAGLNPNLITQD